MNALSKFFFFLYLVSRLYKILQFLVADTQLYTLPCQSVRPSVSPNYFWIRSGFCITALPNHLRLSCRVYSLVTSSKQYYNVLGEIPSFGTALKAISLFILFWQWKSGYRFFLENSWFYRCGEEGDGLAKCYSMDCTDFFLPVYQVKQPKCSTP